MKTEEKESVTSRVIVRLLGALTRDDIEAGAVWRIAGHGFGIDCEGLTFQSGNSSRQVEIVELIDFTCVWG